TGQQTTTLDVMPLGGSNTEVTATTGTDTTSTSTLTIGRNPNFNDPFDGLIDNVFVYNTSLTNAQITAIETSGAPAMLGQQSFTDTHQYKDNQAGNAPYTVTATVTDAGGASGSASTTVRVLNVAPTLTISGAASVNEGSPYTLNLSSSDPAPDTITT